jgi:acetyltransferase-like isoleucine patch superfamily enzyme
MLEPAGALPVTIENGVIMGGNCGVYEGTVVKEGAVVVPGASRRPPAASPPPPPIPAPGT